MKEIPLILPNLQKNRNEKRGMITSLVTGFIRLAYNGISSYLHTKSFTKGIYYYGKSSQFRKEQNVLFRRLYGNVEHL